ncbi:MULTISPECIES: succinylglutamate desuccinylase/aspartoacylase family protein [Crocosphaera]|uniref:FIG003737: Predicted deacylase n=3 Tax=Crocosphaera watsonii TaxID=263511 RepID=T2JJG6_CROWT|nr:MULTISPECIES: succinylglutamate desuccinylase/aspartoacylase family protein [Crocosphaera]EHJ11108.1 Succinylglutamate desuccinylase/aspartoacylase [Crocosphaera watsonii WH 0003]MCH2247692.1 succinylglutamate desuccinylase/aspartoacylase family protein [Crocosphaera sp.]CCQ59140.1 Predicted deacylase [Crocosphaera watsonii WH 0005]CCQ65209.1 FIG003737: Predicted deacylase [Crocosphaera watsonii WH 0402]
MFEIAGEAIPLATSRRFEIPVAKLPTQTMLSLPITVIHGHQQGAVLWLSAAIHGDELNGVEIIRQVLKKIEPSQLSGTLIAVPIVNVFGLIQESRYLPDRRDLNRCFPGSANGSLASRLAHLFMREIVSRSTHGIDLHTGAIHRSNLPQIRANLENEQTYAVAQAFNAPVMIQSSTPDGSLRQAASKKGIPVLLYEAGEALRFDPKAIEVGVKIRKSQWVRASRSGIFRRFVSLGETVAKKQPLGMIGDAFGEKTTTIKAPIEGMVIGETQNPLVNQGDGIIHLGILDKQES